jgi:hypothetical protein
MYTNILTKTMRGKAPLRHFVNAGLLAVLLASSVVGKVEAAMIETMAPSLPAVMSLDPLARERLGATSHQTTQKMPRFEQSLFVGNASSYERTLGLRMQKNNLGFADQGRQIVALDSTYNFDYDFGTERAVKPYLLGGLGLVTIEDPFASDNGIGLRAGDVMPLISVGGGLSYKVGPQLDLAMTYKAGFKNGAIDKNFSGRDQKPVQSQVVDIGLKFTF